LFPESLAGIKIIFELFPLNFGEFLEFKGVGRVLWEKFSDKATHKNQIGHEKLSAYYDEFMEFGGFPGVVLEENRERKKVLLSEIFTSYFEKDVKNLADFKDISKLRDLILLLIPRVGSKIEIVKLASNLGVSRETIYNYLAFLEQTYFITLLPKYSTSVDRQAAGSKKLFWCDAGMVNVLGRVSQGQLFEQSVYQNIRTAGKLAYYSKGEGSEIDFIVDACALEVKWTVSLQDTANLERRGESLKLKEKYVVVHEYSGQPQAVLATDL
jgi:predicted AAA+ superfamily ATPase